MPTHSTQSTQQTQQRQLTQQTQPHEDTVGHRSICCCSAVCASACCAQRLSTDTVNRTSCSYQPCHLERSELCRWHPAAVAWRIFVQQRSPSLGSSPIDCACARLDVSSQILQEARCERSDLALKGGGGWGWGRGRGGAPWTSASVNMS